MENTTKKQNIQWRFVPLLLLFTAILFLLVGCQNSHQNIREFDHKNITSLELFIEQEERWVSAIYHMDSAKATSSIDSIRKLAATPWMEEEFYDLRHSPEFGNYVKTSLLFWSILAIQTDSVYKQATIIAFLPERAYSKKEEEVLFNKLASHDRTMQKLLDSIRGLRKEVTEIIY